MWKLALNRRELEASPCIRLKCFTVRCTWSFVDVKKKRRRLSGIFSKSRKKPTVLAPQQHVAMVGSHTLTIASLSKLKAALQDEECTHSTHFAIGGSRWFLKLCPNRHSKFLSLVRAGRDDEMPTTAELF
jgi:hypothetical protein